VKKDKGVTMFLEGTWTKLRRSYVCGNLKECDRALLDADVKLKIAKEFTTMVRKGLGQMY